jgi:hypothetical protein
VPTNGWSVYKDPTFGFSIGYPSSFVIQNTLKAGGTLPKGWLLAMRAVDSKFASGYPPGVDFGVYSKDADSLTAWVQKHTGPCGSDTSKAYYWDSTSNVVQTTVSGRDALSFDLVNPCGSSLTLRETIFFLGTAYLFRLDWWSSDTTYAATIGPIVQSMLASFSG